MGLAKRVASLAKNVDDTLPGLRSVLRIRWNVAFVLADKGFPKAERCL
jgi:hypothetical protein